MARTRKKAVTGSEEAAVMEVTVLEPPGNGAAKPDAETKPARRKTSRAKSAPADGPEPAMVREQVALAESARQALTEAARQAEEVRCRLGEVCQGLTEAGRRADEDRARWEALREDREALAREMAE